MSARTPSTTSRSRSVALNSSLELRARKSTLERIGIVVRRSTTLVTRPSARKSSLRSITSRIAISSPRFLRGQARLAASQMPPNPSSVSLGRSGAYFGQKLQDP